MGVFFVPSLKFNLYFHPWASFRPQTLCDIWIWVSEAPLCFAFQQEAPGQLRIQRERAIGSDVLLISLHHVPHAYLLCYFGKVGHQSALQLSPRALDVHPRDWQRAGVSQGDWEQNQAISHQILRGYKRVSLWSSPACSWMLRIQASEESGWHLCSLGVSCPRCGCTCMHTAAERNAALLLLTPSCLVLYSLCALSHMPRISPLLSTLYSTGHRHLAVPA